jgi:hypothetical protein
MKSLVKTFLIVAPWAMLLCLGAIYLRNNIFSFPWVWEEKERISAPSGEYDVVTYEGNRGAMSSFAYVCCLVRPQGNIDPNTSNFYDPVLSTTHVAPRLSWENNQRLVISPGKGYVRHLRPYAREFNVTIVLKIESAAP